MRRLLYLLIGLSISACNSGNNKRNEDVDHDTVITEANVKVAAENVPKDKDSYFNQLVKEEKLMWEGLLTNKQIIGDYDTIIIFSGSALTETNISSKYYIGSKVYVKEGAVYKETIGFDNDVVKESDGIGFVLLPFSISFEDIDNDGTKELSFLYCHPSSEAVENETDSSYIVKMIILSERKRYQIIGVVDHERLLPDEVPVNNMDSLNLSESFKAYANTKWRKYANLGMCINAKEFLVELDILDEPAQSVLGFLSFYFCIGENWFDMSKERNIEKRSLSFSSYLNSSDFLTKNAINELTKRFTERITEYKRQAEGEEMEPFERDMLFHSTSGAPDDLKELVEYFDPDKVEITTIGENRKKVEFKDFFAVEVIRKNNSYYIDKILN